MKSAIEILVYITSDESRVLSGDPLTLLVKDPAEQKELVKDLGRALRANVVQLKNGDYMVITEG
jgi:siroheme synthase